MTPAEPHPPHTFGDIVSHYLDAYWHAECACGWRGADRTSSTEAEADLAAHRQATATERPT